MAKDSSRRRDFLILAAQRQERERQTGADTSAGYFMSGVTDIGRYNGDRSFQMVLRTGEDVQSRQALRDSSPLGGILNGGKIYISLLGLWACEYSVNANTAYHIVATFNKATMRARLYVAGAFVSESDPRNAEPIYDSYFSIGNNRSNNNPIYPFQGVVMLSRDFNYELSAEEIGTLDNNGDPAGYVLPVPYKYKVADYISDFSKNTDGWFTPTDSPGVSLNVEGGVLFISGDSTTLKIQNNAMSYGAQVSIFRVRITFAMPFTGNVVQVFAHSSLDYAYLTLSSDKLSADGVVYLKKSPNTKSNSYIYLLDVPIGDVVKISTITIESVGCIAEYLPQNLVVARKRDFPQVVFPVGAYTPSSEVFRVNDPNLTISLSNQPQSNGFSGNFMRFESIKQISTYCAYWNSYLKKNAPIKITVEYRSNYAIYISQETTNAALAKKIGEANEAAPKTVSFVYGRMGSAFLITTANIDDGWLEMRVLSIEVAEGTCVGWFDSAKQLPLNDEYLPPLLETAEGYDLTSQGTPKIIYKSE